MKQILIISLLLFTNVSFGWRETGHWTVCQIAMELLKDTPTHDRISLLTGGKDFAKQCAWPDWVRKTDGWKHSYPWHFVNIDKGSYLSEEHVHAKGDVIQGVLIARKRIKNSTDPVEKLNYLRFLGHLVGDLHMPLHLGRAKDGGGNFLRHTWYGQDKYSELELMRHFYPDTACTGGTYRNPESGQCVECSGDGDIFIDPNTLECLSQQFKDKSVNLHKVWDKLLLDKFKENESIEPIDDNDIPFAHVAYTQRLLSEINESQKNKWASSQLFEWADESLQLRVAAYNVKWKENIDDTYYNQHIDMVNLRLKQAGVRLAKMLKEVFEPAGSIEDKFFSIKLDEAEQQLCLLASSDAEDENVEICN